MQGYVALMQMARTSAAIQKLKDAGLPYIVVLTSSLWWCNSFFSKLGDSILQNLKQ